MKNFSKFKVFILMILLISVVGCANENTGESNKGLRKELSTNEEILLKKDYKDLTEREREIFELLESGDGISDNLKEEIAEDVKRLSEDKSRVLKVEQAEKSKERSEKLKEKREVIEKTEKNKPDKRVKIDEKYILEAIEDYIGVDDKIDSISYKNKYIILKISIDPTVGTGRLPKEMASSRYSSIGERLIEMNKDNRFWDVLKVEFKEDTGEDIGIVRMNYDERNRNEYGEFFSTEKIDKQLGL